MNNCSFTGRITKKPELRTVSINGVDTPVLTFTLACDSAFYRDKDGNSKTKTEFVRITAWRQQAVSIAKYADVGRNMSVYGSIHLNSWSKDGRVQYFLDLHMNGYAWEGSRPTYDSATAAEEAPVPEDAPVTDPDAPF